MIVLKIQKDVPVSAKKRYWYINRLFGQNSKSYVSGPLVKYPINKKGQIFTLFTCLLCVVWIVSIYKFKTLQSTYTGFIGLGVIALLTGLVSRVKTYRRPGKKSPLQLFWSDLSWWRQTKNK